MNINNSIKRPFALLASGVLLLLVIPNSVAAQAACPPGMIPYGTGTDVSSCGPDGSQNQVTNASTSIAPAPIWQSRWGAIATYAPTGVLGVSTYLPTRDQAIQSAIADCKAKGGPTCKLEVAYDNECAAVVVGSTGYNVAADPTLGGAIDSGMETCRSSGAEGCHTYYSACSLPVRVR